MTCLADANCTAVAGNAKYGTPYFLQRRAVRFRTANTNRPRRISLNSDCRFIRQQLDCEPTMDRQRANVAAIFWLGCCHDLGSAYQKREHPLPLQSDHAVLSAAVGTPYPSWPVERRRIGR